MRRQKNFSKVEANVDEMVVAQLVEWSRLTPEISGSDPVIGNSFFYQRYKLKCIEKANIYNGVASIRRRRSSTNYGVIRT